MSLEHSGHHAQVTTETEKGVTQRHGLVLSGHAPDMRVATAPPLSVRAIGPGSPPPDFRGLFFLAVTEAFDVVP